MSVIFLHGLDSSGLGTKGRFFARHYPAVLRPDFSGPLAQRLDQLIAITSEHQNLILVGSSFGGLMAACYAQRFEENVRRLILLAPALNFEEYAVPERMLVTEVNLIIGKHDTVTPMDPVLAAARKSFTNLEITIADDDHLLHDTFHTLDWPRLLS